jgi:hypothetical protein
MNNKVAIGLGGGVAAVLAGVVVTLSLTAAGGAYMYYATDLVAESVPEAVVAPGTPDPEADAVEETEDPEVGTEGAEAEDTGGAGEGEGEGEGEADGEVEEAAAAPKAASSSSSRGSSSAKSAPPPPPPPPPEPPAAEDDPEAIDEALEDFDPSTISRPDYGDLDLDASDDKKKKKKGR